MTKSIHFLLVITLGLWVISPGFAAEAPNTNSTPSPPSSLNPTWKEFLAPPLVPGELPDAHRVNLANKTVRIAINVRRQTCTSNGWGQSTA